MKLINDIVTARKLKTGTPAPDKYALQVENNRLWLAVTALFIVLAITLFKAFRFHDDAVNNLRPYLAAVSPVKVEGTFTPAEIAVTEANHILVDNVVRDYVRQVNTARKTSISAEWGTADFFMSDVMRSKWMGSGKWEEVEMPYPVKIGHRRVPDKDKKILNGTYGASRFVAWLHAQMADTEYRAENVTVQILDAAEPGAAEPVYSFSAEFDELVIEGGRENQKIKMRAFVQIKIMDQGAYTALMNRYEQSKTCKCGAEFFRANPLRVQVISQKFEPA